MKVDGSNSTTTESGEVTMSLKKRKVAILAPVSVVKEARNSPTVEDELLVLENRTRVTAREGSEELDMSVKLELCRLWIR
ncbi:hypothetical protein GIB67_003456 [Kingdonia uniflora]|uniref:Uncharacterized protein n=1 Tax=Kingdonia uniflora TaxID=39325 RepID=A0A7J7P9V7_9MAGN|nr:hypothetical protein GIB67_003456 [Kingdonia uniflora]